MKTPSLPTLAALSSSALSLVALSLVAPGGLAHAAGVDPATLAGNCEAGDVESCLSLARARTGVGLPVDLMSAREAYQKACQRGSQDGCLGYQGIGRLLGRHVDLHLLSSAPRVWVLSGPLWVTDAEELELVDPGLAQVLLARLAVAEACYRTAVESSPNLEGMLDVSLMLSGGQVAETVLHQSSLPDEAASRCIVQAVGTVELPGGTSDGEIFMRLRAEPAPVERRLPPTLNDHLADGAQSTIGDPSVALPTEDPDNRRLSIAATAAVRRELAEAPCILDEVKSGRWAPVGLGIRMTLEPDGRASGVSVVAEPREREELAMCIQERLGGLSVGQTGLDQRVAATVTMRISPLWTDTWVP